MFEVLLIFTRLGLTSFGGPTAHLGYFRDEFVEKRRWLSDDEYADLVALCQFMPGPASSQVGMAIGLKRAGYAGMLVAFVGFTLPSVVLMVGFALGVARLGDISDAGWLAGLKAAAVAVVAQAVMGMANSIVTDRLRAAVALAAFLIVLLVPHPVAQVGAIVAGMIVAAFALSPIDAPPAPSRPSTASRNVGLVALGVFAALLALLPLVGRMDTSWGMFDSFYRSGALVFGGGHVVLPLLGQATVPTGLVDHDTFLAGYGAAQAVPGPLFTFASFLGASAQGVHWLWGATLATVAIFLPAALLVVGVMPFWDRLRANPRAASALAGANAAVVGILAAALYTPVFTSGIHGPATMAVAAAAFVALCNFKAPAWAVVVGAAAVGQVVL
ncbi:chromate transporter [Corynebacterium sp. HMSC034A01]|nr:chromate efflux transporter [Corynebacterium sp. HMSC034A01]OHR20857.1 chromate transporter [Corynebacterium sp. HMSC034A01]